MAGDDDMDYLRPTPRGARAKCRQVRARTWAWIACAAVAVVLVVLAACANRDYVTTLYAVEVPGPGEEVVDVEGPEGEAVPVVVPADVPEEPGRVARMRERCERVAGELNANYARAEPFQSGAESLEDWMADHGVLLTCCTPHWDEAGERMSCTEGHMDHVSASWVSNGTLAIYPKGACRVLDPKQVEIKCVYAVNADTISRSDSGCGPIDVVEAIRRGMMITQEDATGNGTEGIEQAYEVRVAEILGHNGTWQDVHCSDWSYLMNNFAGLIAWDLPGGPDPESCRAVLSSPTADLAKQGTASARSFYTVVNEWSNETLGHPLCSEEEPLRDYIANPEVLLSGMQAHLGGGSNGSGLNSEILTQWFDGLEYWMYVGDCSWPADQFAESEALKMELVRIEEGANPGGVVGVWNEVVLGNEAAEPAAALATFWVSDPSASQIKDVDVVRLAAWAHAEDMGGVPVLEVDPSQQAFKEGRTFACDRLWLLGLES